jgi:hypothetical protein
MALCVRWIVCVPCRRSRSKCRRQSLLLSSLRRFLTPYCHRCLPMEGCQPVTLAVSVQIRSRSHSQLPGRFLCWPHGMCEYFRRVLPAQLSGACRAGRVSQPCRDGRPPVRNSMSHASRAIRLAGGGAGHGRVKGKPGPPQKRVRIGPARATGASPAAARYNPRSAKTRPSAARPGAPVPVVAPP